MSEGAPAPKVWIGAAGPRPDDRRGAGPEGL